LRWAGCANVRDLGGLPLAGGGRTRGGRVIRADALARLTPAGRASLRRHGVRRVVDLRTEEEAAGEAALPGVELVRVPIRPSGPTDPLWPELTAAYDAAPDHEHGLRDFLLDGLARWPGAYARAVGAIGAPGVGAVVVQCAAGRDRTGVVCALLLDAAGVERTAIGDDYALTPAMDGQPAPARWVIEAVLRELDRAHGGTRRYLLGAGLGEPALDLALQRLRG
jgi:protein-tyrosine phosphatase